MIAAEATMIAVGATMIAVEAMMIAAEAMMIAAEAMTIDGVAVTIDGVAVTTVEAVATAIVVEAMTTVGGVAMTSRDAAEEATMTAATMSQSAAASMIATTIAAVLPRRPAGAEAAIAHLRLRAGAAVVTVLPRSLGNPAVPFFHSSLLPCRFFVVLARFFSTGSGPYPFLAGTKCSRCQVQSVLFPLLEACHAHLYEAGRIECPCPAVFCGDPNLPIPFPIGPRATRAPQHPLGLFEFLASRPASN